MLFLALSMLLSGEPPRFLGGAPPTPLAVPGPVDQTPTLQACSTETLRRSTHCVFDARPMVADSDAARKKQAKENLDLAMTLGKGLCRERLKATSTDAKEQARRVSLCLDGTLRVSNGCSLDGVEALLDAEGRFSTRARACYEALAEALQSADVPLAPRAEPVEPNVQKPGPLPTKI